MDNVWNMKSVLARCSDHQSHLYMLHLVYLSSGWNSSLIIHNVYHSEGEVTVCPLWVWRTLWTVTCGVWRYKIILRYHQYLSLCGLWWTGVLSPSVSRVWRSVTLMRIRTLWRTRTKTRTCCWLLHSPATTQIWDEFKLNESSFCPTASIVCTQLGQQFPGRSAGWTHRD